MLRGQKKPAYPMSKLSVLVIACCFLSASAFADSVFPAQPGPPTPRAKEVIPASPKTTPKSFSLPPLRPRPIAWPQEEAVVISPNGVLDLFGGAENYRVAFIPDRIELRKLVKKSERIDAPADFTEGPITPLSVEDEVKLRVVLTDDATYNWSEEYDCAPDYAFRVKFWQKDNLVSLDLCFDCHTLRVVKNDQEIAAKNFEYGYKDLALLVERHFPGSFDDQLRPIHPPPPTTKLGVH